MDTGSGLTPFNLICLPSFNSDRECAVRFTPFFLLLLLSVSELPGQTPVKTERLPIGVVIQSRGMVTARNPDGQIRPLTRRAVVLVSDTIITDANQDVSVQIKLNDEARISLQPGSELTFDTFEFDPDPAIADTVLMSMARGCIRTISGIIGKARADDYRLDTPYASIGIVGTTYRLAIAGNGLYAGVSNGSITLSNARGTVTLGGGSNYDFARVGDNQAPMGLPEEWPGSCTNNDLPDLPVAVQAGTALNF